MASLSFYSQFETSLMSNRKVIELLLQLKSAKAPGKSCIKVKPHLVCHLLRNRLFENCMGTLKWFELVGVRVTDVILYTIRCLLFIFLLTFLLIFPYMIFPIFQSIQTTYISSRPEPSREISP